MTYEAWYLDFEGDIFEGEIGPFASIEAAEDFARNLSLQGRSASWSIIPLTRPEDLL